MILEQRSVSERIVIERSKGSKLRDQDGNETTTPEEWTPWMMDASKWVPFLHAGWRINDRRITVLEGVVGDHAVEVEDLRADLTALQAVVIELSGP